MSHICKCGGEIHPKRVEILKNNGSRITCLKCSDTQKKVGFQVSAGKTEYFVEAVSPEQYKRLKSLDHHSH